MNERRRLPNCDEVAIAALLHDIGKFQQRAMGSSKLMPQQVQDRASIVLPVYQGRSSHWHALWSDAFFAEVVDQNPFPKSLDRRWVRDLAVFHHRPTGNLEGGVENGAVTHLVSEADRIASGMERKKRDEDEDTEPSGLGRDKYRKTSLDSIFGQIAIHPGQAPPKQLRHKLAELSAEALRPVVGGEIDSQMPHDFARLWPQFVAAYKVMADHAGDDVIAFHEGLLSLSERFTWAIPSSTLDQPDVSLHDHSRAVSAAAACLFRHHEHLGTLADSGAITDRSASKFRFITGDLSGIQPALFRLASEGATGLARVLRGRSLRFQLIAESIARMALVTFALPASCVLQNAGGRFLVLAPLTEDARQNDDLGALRIDVDRWMRSEYSGELTFNLAMTEAFSGNDLMDQKRYPSIMDKVVLAAENAKLRPLAGARTPLGDEHPDGAEFGICPTCGVRPALRDDGHGTFRCSACDAETRLGRAYPKARAVVLDSRNIQGRIDRIGDINIGLPDAPFPSIAGRGFRFRGEAEHPKLPLAEKFAGAYVPRHTAATLARADLSGARADAGEADDAEVGDILTFAELAVLSQADGKGRAMLATLKADVDRLGQIFTRGMGERRSLARTAALSRMMDAFFTGFLPHRLKQDFPWIYTVYAGGDDLLLLGPWRDILRFGQVLRDDFDAFTGHSAHVTLSCGIALFAPKMPVSLAAHEAEERLSQAKHSGRNRVHLITPVESTALTWVEYRVALDDAETLHAYLNDPHSGVTTALLYKLLWFDDRHKQADAGRPEAFDWIGKLGYLLHRTLGGTQHDTVRQYLLKLMGLGPQMKLFGGAAAPAARIALSIAIYRNR